MVPRVGYVDSAANASRQGIMGSHARRSDHASDRVGAHQEVQLAIGQVLQQGAALLRRRGAGQQRHIDVQLRHPFAELGVVLLGQHLGGPERSENILNLDSTNPAPAHRPELPHIVDFMGVLLDLPVCSRNQCICWAHFDINYKN